MAVKTLDDFRRDTDPLYVRHEPTAVFSRELRKDARRFIITAAQNATPVHKRFAKALSVACDHLNAELLVVPIRYKNPTSRWTGSQRNEEFWAPEVQPYLWNVRHALNKNITLIGDVKTQPTAVSPLAGFEAVTHGESGILAHTKLQLRIVPTPQSSFPKILTTTGACTVANYTDTPRGKLGSFHHTLGAALVEVKGKQFHLRQINASKETGAFIDLDTEYTASGVRRAPRALALSLGDWHKDFTSPDVERATFGKGGIVPVLQPRVIFWHDLDDNYSTNPHHGANPFIAFAKRGTNRHRVLDELKRAVEYVQKKTPKDTKSVIVFSNHNEFLARWIVNTDWRQLADRDNIVFYLTTAAHMAEQTKLGEIGTEYPDPFTWWAQKLLPNDGRFVVLDRDQSYMLGGTEWGMHGDDGPNGSRGSLRNYRRIGVKSVSGHDHTGGIEEGAYRGGTSTRRKAEYTRGPSSWMNTHVAGYANSKRSLLNIIDGEWRI